MNPFFKNIFLYFKTENFFRICYNLQILSYIKCSVSKISKQSIR